MNPTEAETINIHGTRYFINEALKRNARVIFFSSDLVFGCSPDIADEHTAQSPYSLYGKMKLKIEMEFDGFENFRVVRPSYIYSSDRFLTQLKEHAKSCLELQVFHPIFRNAIHRDDVVAAIGAMMEQWDDFNFRVVNLCGTEFVSRLDIVKSVAQHAGLQVTLRGVHPNDDFYLARPPSIRMHSLHLSTLLGRQPRSLDESLRYE